MERVPIECSQRNAPSGLAISFYRNVAKTACTQAVLAEPALQIGDLLAANRLGTGGFSKPAYDLMMTWVGEARDRRVLALADSEANNLGRRGVNHGGVIGGRYSVR